MAVSFGYLRPHSDGSWEITDKDTVLGFKVPVVPSMPTIFGAGQFLAVPEIGHWQWEYPALLQRRATGANGILQNLDIIRERKSFCYTDYDGKTSEVGSIGREHRLGQMVWGSSCSTMENNFWAYCSPATPDVQIKEDDDPYGDDI
ncbi:hypothetical protein Tco_0713083 [Tanacetum coccineum]